MKQLMPIAFLLIGMVIAIPVVDAEILHLTYDANGNLIRGDGKFRVYNALNQLVEVYNGSDSSGNLLERYEWDPLEERTLVKDVFESGSIKETVYYINQNFYQVENDSGLFNFTEIYQDEILIAENTPSGKKFISSDPLGSSSLLMDSIGTPIENTTYDPFGNIIAGGSGRFDYEDKEYSELTQDYDFHFRKYDPALKIFTQPDTYIQYQYDSRFLNRYSFEINNPYRYIDPTGHVTVGFTGYGAPLWCSSGDCSGIKQIDKDIGAADALIAHDQFESTTVFGLIRAYVYVQQELAKDPNQPVIIYGHSMGGRNANYLTTALAASGVKTDQLYTIDTYPTTGMTDSPAGAESQTNFYQNTPGESWQGAKVEGAAQNVQSTKVKHNDMDSQSNIQKTVTQNAVKAEQNYQGPAKPSLAQQAKTLATNVAKSVVSAVTKAVNSVVSKIKNLFSSKKKKK